jgi:phosphoenolpyruvate-protein kinase (PTS system EI component)
MNPMAIPVVKRIIRMTSLQEATELAEQALLKSTETEVNDFVTQKMNDRFPEIFRFGRPLTNNLAP